MSAQYLEDWIDPDNHEAHRRFASENPANYIGCKTDCQSAYVLVPELNEAKAEIRRLLDGNGKSALCPTGHRTPSGEPWKKYLEDGFFPNKFTICPNCGGSI